MELVLWMEKRALFRRRSLLVRMLAELAKCFCFVAYFVVVAYGILSCLAGISNAVRLRSRSLRGKVVEVGLASFLRFFYGRFQREV
jgi:hypothetical protein